MPASNFSSPNTKWKRRKKEGSNLGNNSKRQKPEDEDDDEEDVEDEAEIDEDDDLHPIETAPTRIEKEVLSGGGTRISDFPKVIAHIVNQPHSSVMEIVSNERQARFGGNRSRSSVFMENISHGQLQAVSLVPRGNPLFIQEQELQDGASASSSYVCTPPAMMEGRGVVKQYGNNQRHVVPMHADWFSPNSVNRLERQVVPLFFSGKSGDHTPKKYMECRNSIVFKYMENPEKRLLVNDCQGLVPGVDLHDLNRIVRFLDHWGIINYNAPAPNREPILGAPYIKEDQNGDLHIHSAALKSIYSLIHFDMPKSRIRPDDLCSSPLSPGDEISDLDNRIRERLSDDHCNYCSRPLPPVNYLSLKEADVMLCLDCYNEGRFVVGHSSIDFTRMNSTIFFSDVDGDSWTDQETLLLLEALEIYNDNWTEIAEHVGTKSKAECILHFIRLPLEDGPLENIEIPSRSLASDASSREDQGRPHSDTNDTSAMQRLEDLESESRLPFANSGNPVMALVAFVSSALGPRVASACAHASLAVLSKEDCESITSKSTVEMGDFVHGDRTSMESRLADGNIRVQGSSGENHAHATPLSSDSVKNAAKLGLAAAATKAKHFADHEEREIQRMTASIINHQLRKLDAKLKQFAEIETVLMKETEQVEKVRQRFAAERARIMTTGFLPSGANTAPSIPGAAASALPNNNAMNLQPLVSASTSQTNIPGYGNNQSTHPQMSFMPRQSMFSFGPRLPLSAIHPSSSTTPSASTMFNTAPTNMGHPMLRPVSGTNTNVS